MNKDLEARHALIDSLEVGDLIRLNSKTRVVRAVGYKRGRVSHIVMSIMRCSWTRRPYTVRCRSDLYKVDLQLVKKGYGISRTELEDLLQQEINDRNLRMLTCCDVVGVP